MSAGGSGVRDSAVDGSMQNPLHGSLQDATRMNCTRPRRRESAAGAAPRLLAATLLLLFGAGCTRPSDDRLVVRMWAIGREAEIAPTLLADFERTHPRIRVEVQALP